MLINVISAEIFPDLHSIAEGDVMDTTDAITSCCFRLVRDLKWVSGEASNIQDFCCRFTVSCCSTVKISCENFSWIPKSLQPLLSLSKLYQVLHRKLLANIQVKDTLSIPDTVSNPRCIE